MNAPLTPDPLMPGIDGGCRTMVAADRPASCTFSHAGGTLLIITPDGELVPGDALSGSDATRQLADMLVDAFGRSYGSKFGAAEEERRQAVDELRRGKAQLKGLVDRAKHAEDRAERAEKALHVAQKDLVALRKQQERADRKLAGKAEDGDDKAGEP